MTRSRGARRARAGGVGILLGLALLGACDEPGRGLPPALLGRWHSEDPRYAGRVLELEPRRVRILSGTTPIDVHDVVRVHVDEAAGDRVVYRVHFRAAEGYDDALDLTLEPGARARLLVGAQPSAWTRSP